METKVSAEISAESSPRSEQSADKSADSGISGDHAHSDERIESPTRQVSKEITTIKQINPCKKVNLIVINLSMTSLKNFISSDKIERRPGNFGGNSEHLSIFRLIR